MNSGSQGTNISTGGTGTITNDDNADPTGFYDSGSATVKDPTNAANDIVVNDLFAIINDNRDFIAERKISDYLIENLENSEHGLFEYLTDEEIQEIESDDEKHEEVKEEVIDFIEENYDFPAKTYDVVFDDDTAMNEKGFKATLEYCKDYVINNNTGKKTGTYFDDYRGGTVMIVCNETEEVAAMQPIK